MDQDNLVLNGRHVTLNTWCLITVSPLDYCKHSVATANNVKSNNGREPQL